MDFRKAFDSVSREGLFDIVAAYGVPQEIIKAIRAIRAIGYKSFSSKIPPLLTKNSAQPCRTESYGDIMWIRVRPTYDDDYDNI